ncbi:hypothetical protein M407DRAFT_244701 [Tulasnella calospora MUT 4182]|uniref:Uncharacterized protein n=1 Tax=Tulasnella calospora MUT 4182 TaxID=1051891 RepID=A0A0C3KQJ2_9AGAM|nr:hypothetical protein M407DRAFT_244701 [Tulasnella calospora MUT 4182]
MFFGTEDGRWPLGATGCLGHVAGVRPRSPAVVWFHFGPATRSPFCTSFSRIYRASALAGGLAQSSSWGSRADARRALNRCRRLGSQSWRPQDPVLSSPHLDVLACAGVHFEDATATSRLKPLVLGVGSIRQLVTRLCLRIPGGGARKWRR